MKASFESRSKTFFLRCTIMSAFQGFGPGPPGKGGPGPGPGGTMAFRRVRWQLMLPSLVQTS